MQITTGLNLSTYQRQDIHPYKIGTSLITVPRTRPTREPSLPVTLLVGKDDTVVDPKFAVEFFTGNAKVVTFETGGHRMENTEENLVEIEKAIRNAATDG